MNWKMRLYYTVGRHIPMLKIPPPSVDRQAAMTLRPARNSVITWEKKEGGESLLTIPRNEKAGFLTKWMSKWLNAPTARKVELDEVGGYVWDLCDGKNTVETIVQRTGREFSMNRREAEVSVTMFLQMLHERHFIGFYKKTTKKS